MESNKSRVYLGTLLAVFLFLAPNLSWATFNLIRDARDPSYRSGLQSFKNKDYADAYRIWRPLAENGNSKAQYYIGYMYLNGLYVSQDAAEARKWFELAADQGDALAQNDLGTLFLNGQGVQRNLDTALKWLQLSAEQNNATAKYNLGVLYSIRKRFDEARAWFEASAMQGYAKANYRLQELPSFNPRNTRLFSAKNLVCSKDPNVRSLLPPPLCMTPNP